MGLRKWSRFFGRTLGCCTIVFGAILYWYWDRINIEAYPNDLKNNGGCRIPDLNPWDQTIVGFIAKPEPFTCPESGLEGISISADSRLTFDNSGSFTDCSIQAVIRKDDNEQKLGNETKLNNGTEVPSDFFKISCPDGRSKFYASVKPTFSERKRKDGGTGLNVLILGFDSTSRLNFIRQMPRTFQYLSTELKAVILRGYNIVGDGTPQALIPILTGKTEEELPLTRKRFSAAHYVDDVYPFIWKEFKEAGYATMFAEDAGEIGTFQYRLKGFRNQPTDHYMRPFVLLNDRQKCHGHEIAYQAFFHYAKSLLTNYPSGTPKFAFNFHDGLSHDDINKLNLADEFMQDYLSRLRNEGHLNNTLLVVMADHGARFASLRQTQQGQLEERLPMFSFVAPEWFRRANPAAWRNLKLNAGRLTTPFDIHPTLQAVLNWRPPRVGNTSERAISLWDRIPASRTCSEAGVEDHWCTCLLWKTVSTRETLSKLVSESLVKAINNVTERNRNLCAALELDRILSVQRQVPHESLLRYRDAKDADGFVADLSGDTKVTFAVYRVTIVAKPGGGIFEATFCYSEQDGASVDPKAISRTNKYGDTPHCIMNLDGDIRPYCVCHDRIKR